MMDALLFSYSLLLSLASYRIILPDNDSYKIHQNNVASLAFLLLFIPLGLLPLIKSTLIISGALAVGLCSAMFLYDRKAWFACAVILFPIFGLVLFWHLAGQPLDAIPDFFISANAIVSGYSESMQLTKSPVYVLIFIITAILVLRTVLGITTSARNYRSFLFSSYLLFLFISFKTGLVRYGSVHSIISASALIIAIITLAFISSKKIPLWLIVLGIVSCWLIGKKNIVYVAYIDAWKGAEARLHHELPGKYENSLRQQIGLVSQNVVLFNDTIRNNIAYGSLQNASESEVINAARKAHALEFIEKLPDGFNTMVGDNGLQLSGGQRQHIAIARVLLKNAPILILDEAPRLWITNRSK